MSILSQNIGEICLINVQEVELSSEIAQQVKEELLKRIEQSNQKIILSLEKVKYLDSSILGILLSVRRFTREHGGDLKLINLQKPISDIFAVTQLDNVFEIYEKQAEAIKSFE